MSSTEDFGHFSATTRGHIVVLAGCINWFPKPGKEASCPLPDGKWFGEVVRADSGELEFDLACWFDGDAAIAAAAEDGESLHIDYYVRNVNTTTRTLPIADDTTVVWYGMDAGNPSDPETVSYAEWRVFDLKHICCAGVWLTVDAGVVTRIEEQWVA